MIDKIAERIAKIPNKILNLIYITSYIIQFVLGIHRIGKYYAVAGSKILFVISVILQILLLGWICGLLVALFIAYIQEFVDKK